MIPLSVVREYMPKLKDEDLKELGPVEYDQSKVPEVSKKHAENVRRKVYLPDMTESFARGVEYAGLIASEAVDISNETKDRQDSVESQFNSVQQELTDKDVISAPEIIAARNGEANLSARLDKEQQEVSENSTDLENRGYNIQWSALEVLDDDWTDAINEALKNYKEVYIPNNAKLNVQGTIIIGVDMSLRLGNNSELIKTEISDNNEPIVWINGSNAALKGAGLTNSKITSKKPSPLGVVCLGYKGFSDTTPKNIVYDTIKDIGIFGRTQGGETTGLPSYSLYLCNSELSSLPSYFHTLDNLYLANSNVGLMLEGSANANIINNIQLHQVGNNKQLDGAGIKLKTTNGKPPVDNVINNVFHHASLNADTLFLDNGVSYNSIQNLNSEQGGASARWIKENGISSNNVISGIDNVVGGTNVSDSFFSRNTIIRNKQVSSPELTAIQVKSKRNFVGEHQISSSFTVTNLTESTAYKLLKIDTTPFNYGTGIVELSVSIRSASNIPVYKTGSIKYEISTTSTGARVVKKILDFSTDTLFIEPIIDGKVLSFGIRTPNNGTATKGLIVHLGYNLFGPLVTGLTPTELVNGPEIIASPILIPTHYPQTTMSGTTTQRYENPFVGQMYFDTIIKKPIWWDGTTWRDANGTSV